MKQIKKNDLPLWQFNGLSEEEAISHFISSRWKSSDTPSESFTLSLSSTPDRNTVLENRTRLAGAMGIPTRQLILPSQVHGTRIVHVTRDTELHELQETDALVTAEKSLCLAVLSADCVPILMYDRTNNVIAAVHSGWRGTTSKIVSKTLQEMAGRYGTKGEDIVAGIGPSISGKNYEVGREVIEAVNEAFGNHIDFLVNRSNDKGYLDLWEANATQLIAFGIPRSQIEISNLCTMDHNEHFFSARKGDTGRFAAGIMLV